MASPPPPLQPSGADKEPLSLLVGRGRSGPGQAEPPPFPGRPRLSSHIGRLCFLQLRATQAMGAPLFPLRSATVRIPSTRQSRSPLPPPGANATRRAPFTPAPDSATRVCSWGTLPASRALGSRSRGPGDSVTWVMSTRGPPPPPTWRPWPSRVGRRGDRGMRVPGPRAPSAPSAALFSSQPASGSAALFPPPPRLSPLRGAPVTAPPRGPEADRPAPVPAGNASRDSLPIHQLVWSQPSALPVLDTVTTIAT